MSENTLDLVKRVVSVPTEDTKEPSKAVMLYIPIGLFAEFKAYIGEGNMSKVVTSLIKDGLDNWDKAKLISKEHRATMTAARESALKAARSKKRDKT